MIMQRTLLIKPRTIFFVDVDDERKMISKAFVDSFECVYFERVEDCFALFQKLSTFPDMIFIDPIREVSRSLDLVRFVSVLGIPVIIILGSDDKSLEPVFLMAGGLDVLFKPLTKDVLYIKLDSILQRSFIQNKCIEKINLSAQKDERYFDMSGGGDPFFQALSSLSSVLDAKDSYTQGHSLRVSLYSCVLARKYGLTEQEVAIIHYCALVHDIGKVGVPDTVLKKGGKLTIDERALINRHTITGYEVLKNISIMPDLAKVARSHHERWDGTGYPDGLSGEDIPLYARIVSIADSFDAMSSNRSYRASMSFAKARDEILRCSGTEFDPVLSQMAADVINEYLEKNELPSIFE